LGIKIEIIDDRWEIHSPPIGPVKLRILDIANGLLRYRSHPLEARKWARLVLASPFTDLSDCETETGWEVLLTALWDAMDSGNFSEEALKIAEEVANSG
jgi:hypothetical protein